MERVVWGLERRGVFRREIAGKQAGEVVRKPTPHC